MISSVNFQKWTDYWYPVKQFFIWALKLIFILLLSPFFLFAFIKQFFISEKADNYKSEFELIEESDNYKVFIKDIGGKEIPESTELLTWDGPVYAIKTEPAIDGIESLIVKHFTTIDDDLILLTANDKSIGLETVYRLNLDEGSLIKIQDVEPFYITSAKMIGDDYIIKGDKKSSKYQITIKTEFN